jgi:hypothetical protein
MRERRLQVFVSSTYTDMIDERKAAVEAILEAGHIPAGMELFTAGDIAQWSFIKRWIQDSDVYMLIAGGRYGSVSPGKKKSYTELVYEFARQVKKPMFSVVASEAFIKQKVDNGLFPGSGPDFDLAAKLRARIAKSKVVTFFDNRDQLKNQVQRALEPLSSQSGITGWVRAPLDPGPVLLFPQTWRVGHGYLPDVEKSHNFTTIREMLLDQPKATLQLGSPYLRYWIDPVNAPRLRWLLENTKKIRMQVVLFERTDRSTKQYRESRAAIARQCRFIAREHPRRLTFKECKRATDLSYIVYPLRETNGATCRAMIGVQTKAYDKRPFLEMVYSSASPPPLVLAVQAFHNENLNAP